MGLSALGLATEVCFLLYVAALSEDLSCKRSELNHRNCYAFLPIKIEGGTTYALDITPAQTTC